MASVNDQAEIVRNDAGNRYGDINVYGNAILGDGDLTVQPHLVDPQERKRQELVDDLDYDGSGAKRDQLNLTEIGTASFDWVKETPLHEWLRHGTSAFWISGKPGSGKSTLMRYLVDSRSTQQCLDSDENHWTILHFFYDYRAGHSLGNAPIGMLRTFLLQLLRSVRSVAERIDERRIRGLLLGGSTDDFIDMFAEYVRLSEVRICAFIDGLDEYDGRLWELCSHLELLRDRTGIKMCLASRPEPELVNALSSLPTIVMQEHNDKSIQCYIERRVMEKSCQFPSIRSVFSDQLALSLREKSQGVILWARLVVNEMMDTYDHSITEDTLSMLLTSMPPELEQLYDRLLTRLPSIFKGDAVTVLNLVACYSKGYTLHANVLFEALSYIFEIQSSSPFFGHEGSALAIESSVRTHLCGLLDIYTGNRDLNEGQSVRLIHETLATYLRRSDYLKDLLPPCAQRYSGPTSWTYLALDTFDCATDISAFDFSTLRSDLMEFFRSRPSRSSPYTIRTNSDENFQPGRLPEYLSLPKWETLRHFLVTCCIQLPHLLQSHPEVPRDSFLLTRRVLSSDAALFCIIERSLGRLRLIVPTDLTAAKCLRLWASNRLDLVISSLGCMTSYLCEALERLQLEVDLQRDVFDILVIQHTGTMIQRPIDADLLYFVEHPALHKMIRLDGRHVCTIDHTEYFSRENAIILFNSVSSKRVWSRAHDKDCKYHSTAKSLMAHWCEAPPSEYEALGNVKRFQGLILQTGISAEDSIDGHKSPMEAIMDAARVEVETYKANKSPDDRLDSSKIGQVLLYKVAVLIESPDHLPSRDQFKRALKCASALRRKVALLNLTRKVTGRHSFKFLAQDLDQKIIPGLKGLAAKDSFTKAELQNFRGRLL